MENVIILDGYEYFSKVNIKYKIDSIKNDINNIKENYNELNKYCKNSFVFPIKEYNIIKDSINNVKKNSDINIEIYSNLKTLLKEFSQKIKESSYEIFFNNIKNNNDKIIELNNEIYSMLYTIFFNKELSPTNDFEKENTSQDYNSFYSNDISSTKTNYQISFTCSTDKCVNDVKYICKDHCYKYFC